MGWHLPGRKTVAPLLAALAAALVLAPGVSADPGPETRRRRVNQGAPPAGLAERRIGRGGAPVYSLAIPDHPAVRAELNRYLTEGRATVASALRRAQGYRAFIASRLQAAGLPRELLFLPVLESGYSIYARSRTGALGLWQIASNTAAPLGLERSEWVDQRRDFWLSTDAALAKLQELHRRFGDWPLALAAYNCGPGCISRAIAAAGTRDFWALREQGLLSGETARYVPRFFALVQIGSYPARYGFDPGWPRSTVWGRVRLERSIDLSLLAERASVPLEILRSANAELQGLVTPPGPYWLKAPGEHQARIEAVLADPQEELMRFAYHRIRTGDTLYGLARGYGVSLALLLEANRGVEPRRLALGSLLRIPAASGASPALASLPAAAAAQADAAEAALAFSGRYRVAPGDTLWSLARRFGTTVELLAAANDRSLNGLLRAGDMLRVPQARRPESGATRSGPPPGTPATPQSAPPGAVPAQGSGGAGSTEPEGLFVR